MSWFWLNIPFGVVFFLAIAGIPLWMVIRHPDYGPASAESAGKGARAQAGTATVAGMTDRPAVPAQIWNRRDFVGASVGDRS
jgi:hypothetical protein